MTELELYKYINDNAIEWRRQDNDGTPDVMIFPNFYQLEAFYELISNHNIAEGIPILLKNGYAAIWMNDICDCFGIYIDRIFDGDGD